MRLTRLDILDPTVVQDTRWTTINLLAGRCLSGPFSICPATSGRCADHRVSVLALVRHDRIVCIRGVHRVPVHWILRFRALHRCNLKRKYFLARKETSAWERLNVEGRKRGEIFFFLKNGIFFKIGTFLYIYYIEGWCCKMFSVH